MSATEFLVIIGGLYFGYVVVFIVMERSKDATTEKHETKKTGPNQNGGASSRNTDDSKTYKQNTHKRETAKEETHIPSRWFHILSVPETSTMSEITRQYKRKISEYHPDKVASLGKELRDLAETKSKEINLAYDYVKKLKGR